MELDLPYHRQDYWFTCGAACVQMTLAGLGIDQQNQSALYEDARRFSTETDSFAVDPDGLEQLMNRQLPARQVRAWAQPDEESTSRKICWSIKKGVAPIALVFDGGHWVVIRGYHASADPMGPTDTSYTIHSFDVSNPAPELMSLPTPPSLHNSTDQCGINSLGRLSSPISYEDWRSWMTPNNRGTKWRGMFVVIADPDPPPPSSAAAIAGVAPASDMDGIGDDIVIGGAFGGIRTFGLDKHKDWAALLTGAQAQRPVLRVRRLDRSGDDYFLVPIRQGNQLNVVVLVSARSGKYLQAIAAPGPRNSDIVYLDGGSVVSSLAGKQVQCDLPPYRLSMPSEKWSVDAGLVWMPCRESLSPYFPFYVLISEQQRLYVRIDGKVFDRLNPVAGGPEPPLSVPRGSGTLTR